MKPMKSLSAWRLFLLSAVAGATLFGGWHFTRYCNKLSHELSAKLTQAKQSKLSFRPRYLDYQGRAIHQFGSHISDARSLPKHLIQAFVAAEDHHFFTHPGIDPRAIIRSLLANLRAGSIVQGGSTITQQLARILYLTGAKTLDRKLKEALLAIALEAQLTKHEILTAYLNRTFFGRHSQGLAEASWNYFGIPHSQVSIGQAAMLAGLPKAPSRLAPHRHYQRAKKRQAWVLGQMHKLGMINRQAYRYWLRQKLAITRARPGKLHGYFWDQLAAEKQEKALRLRKPQTIKTSLDPNLQKDLESQLRLAHQREWRASPTLQAAAIALDPQTGEIRALLGGLDYSLSQYNRALRTRRQFGGMFLPHLAGLALKRGATYHQRWQQNSRTFAEASLSQRLQSFDPLAMSPIYEAVGLRRLSKHLNRLKLGINPHDFLAAMGYGNASLAEIARAWTPILNNGFLVPLSCLARRTINPNLPRVISPPHALATRTLLQEISLKLQKQRRVASQSRADIVYVSASPDLHNGWAIRVDEQRLVAVWFGSESGEQALGSNEKEITEKMLRVATQWQTKRFSPRLSSPHKKNKQSIHTRL